MTRAIFLSDLHLKSMSERNSQTLLRFFRFLRQERENPVTHLFLVGDIFDLWIGSHRYFVDHFKPLIEELRALRQNDVEIHYFEGNHDLYLEDFWARDVGLHVHPDAQYFELAGQVARVEHGDLINPEDKGYLFLRALLRSKGVTWLARNLPAGVVTAIGERASRASREYNTAGRGSSAERIRALVRRHAENKFMERPYDLIVTGHVHIRDDFAFEASGRRVRSVNLGSWFDEPMAFELSESGGKFIPVHGV